MLYSFNLDQRLFEDFVREASKQKLSVSQAIVEAINDWIDSRRELRKSMGAWKKQQN